MKHKFMLFISIIVFLSFVKVNAITEVSLTNQNGPSNTEAGNYFSFSLNSSGKSSSGYVYYEFEYDDYNLTFVGFKPGNDPTCVFNATYKRIFCTGSGNSVVSPVFYIKNTFEADKRIKVKAYEPSASGVPSVSGALTVKKKDKSIAVSNVTIESTANNVVVGGTISFSATVMPENATNKSVTWQSSNPEIGTIDNTGLFTSVNVGETTITATAGGVSTTKTIKVEKENVDITDIKLEESEITLTVGDTKRVLPKLEPDNNTFDGQLNWTSSDSKVVIIDQDEKIIAVGQGEATITISAGTISTKLKVIVNPKEEKKKENTALIPCVITAIVTAAIMGAGMFVKNIISGRSDNNITENFNTDSFSDDSSDTFKEPDPIPKSTTPYKAGNDKKKKKDKKNKSNNSNNYDDNMHISGFW